MRATAPLTHSPNFLSPVEGAPEKKPAAAPRGFARFERLARWLRRNRKSSAVAQPLAMTRKNVSIKDIAGWRLAIA